MTLQTEIPLPPPSAQVVGNAFVEQYYHILHQTPESVYRFYQDSSVLSRPEPDGVMTSVTTKKGINEKICSLDYKNYKAEIKTADAQDSFKDGVIVLVTGCLTRKDNLRRKFTQSFFLAPQDNGYFVLNDVFRYVEEENEPLDTNIVTIEIINDTQSGSLAPDPEPSRVLDPPVQEQSKSHVEELQNVEGKTDDPIDNESQLANEKAAVDPEPQPNENHNLEPASSYAQEDAPKKSYASIVSSQTKKGNSGDSEVYVPTNTSRVAPTKTEKHSVRLVSQDPAPAASAPNAPESSNAQDEGVGHSSYIKNLPLNVTVTQLEAEFKKFGPIKQGGVQVRSNKLQGFCSGFVEFKDLNSMSNAIQASPITIGDRQAAVEIKRTTTRVGSARGHFPSGRGGFQNDSFRGRGNFSSDRGYGRNDFGGRGDFSGRGRGPGGRGGEGYHQARGRGVLRSVRKESQETTLVERVLDGKVKPFSHESRLAISTPIRDSHLKPKAAENQETEIQLEVEVQGSSVPGEKNPAKNQDQQEHLSSNVEVTKNVSATVVDKVDNWSKVSHPSLEIVPIAFARRKLLILDINGLLADVVFPPPKECKGDVHILRRAIFKRPFYYEFLKFCFERFDVGIWSSRSKKIVGSVVDYLLGDMKHKLLFCWDMSHCTETGFYTLENRHKPLVCKELRKIWEKDDTNLPWEKGHYDESNTMLLDDSPYKALFNPMHCAVFPSSFSYKDKNDTSLGPEGDLLLYVENLANAQNMKKYVEQHPFGQSRIDETSSCWDFYYKVLCTQSTLSTTSYLGNEFSNSVSSP